MYQKENNSNSLINIDDNNKTLLLLFNQLNEFKFTNLESYPWPGKLKSLYNDLIIFYRFLLNHSNCWQESFLWRVYLEILKKYDSKLSILAITFMWCMPIKKQKLHKVLGSKNCKFYLDKNLLIEKNHNYLSRIRATPWSNQIIFSDAPPLFIKNVVFIGPDSFTFIRNLNSILKYNKEKFNNVLDVCTGSGIHAQYLKEYSNSVIGSDINKRAISFANLNNKINIKKETKSEKVKFIHSDLFSKLPDIKFDLVVANTPFLFLPEELREYCVDGDGGFMGIEFVIKLINKIPSHIKYNGRAIFYSNSPIINNKKDLLKEELVKFQKINPCKITLKQIHTYYNPNFSELYSKYNISYFVSYIIDIKFSGNTEILVEKLPLLRNMFCNLRIKYQKTKLFLKSNCAIIKGNPFCKIFLSSLRI